MFSKKNDTNPMEDETSAEFLMAKNDCALMAFGSHNKKRPNNLVLVRPGVQDHRWGIGERKERGREKERERYNRESEREGNRESGSRRTFGSLLVVDPRLEEECLP